MKELKDLCESNDIFLSVTKVSTLKMFKQLNNSQLYLKLKGYETFSDTFVRYLKGLSRGEGGGGVAIGHRIMLTLHVELLKFLIRKNLILITITKVDVDVLQISETKLNESFPST